MDEQFEFWNLIITEVQIGLDGKEYPKDVIYEYHILHSGRLMCKESMEVLKNRVKTKCEAETVKDKIVKKRVGKNACPLCQEKYRESVNSAYRRWVEGSPKVPATKEFLSPHVKP